MARTNAHPTRLSCLGRFLEQLAELPATVIAQRTDWERSMPVLEKIGYG